MNPRLPRLSCYTIAGIKSCRSFTDRKPDGSFFVGDVFGEIPEKSWCRLTPYSPTERQ